MRRAVIIVLTIVLLASVSLAAYAAPAFESVVPEDTIAFITLRNIQTTRDRIKTYSVYDMWQEPAVQQFLEKPIARLKEEIEKALGHFHIRSRRPSLYEMITRGPDTSTEPVWERRRKLLEKKGPRPGNCR